MNRLNIWLGAITATCVLSHSSAADAFLLNGDFETGDLTGWTVFTTDNGTVGQPTFPSIVPELEPFDSAGLYNLALQTGQQEFERNQLAGGGIFQTVDLAAGSFELTADIGVWSEQRNVSGGLLEMMFDGEVVAWHNFGVALEETLKTQVLRGRVTGIAAGEHEVRLQVRRPYEQATHTPVQYIDNVTLSAIASDPVQDSETVPEPSMVLAALVGGAAIAAVTKRR